MRADVTAAQPLTDPHRAALESELAKLSGKRVRMQYSTDDSGRFVNGVLASVAAELRRPS